MRIISTTDLSREGNMCYIRSSVTLMEDKNVYFVVLVENVSGYPYSKEAIICGKPTTNRLEAEFYYKDNGGIINENIPHVRMDDNSLDIF